MSKEERLRRDWRKPIQLPNSGDAETWAYLSKSGRTLQVYVRPMDGYGDPILSTPVRVTVRLRQLKRKGAND